MATTEVFYIGYRGGRVVQGVAGLISLLHTQMRVRSRSIHFPPAEI